MIEKFTTKVSINTKGEAIRFAKECEQVADEYAIGFAEWMLGDDAWRVTEETLENYKKTL
jgi:hypothetical protein